MRKLKLQTQISIDGFLAGPNGEMDWIIWDWDDQLKDYVTNLTEPVDTILLGRILAQGFIPTWTSLNDNPETADAGTHKMVDTPKVVFSKTLETSEWPQTTLAKGDLAEEVAKLKAQKGGDIIAYGGGRFVSSLIKENLIDEYYLFVNPVVLGQGMPIFQDLQTRLALKLVQAQAFECGIVALHYSKAT